MAQARVVVVAKRPFEYRGEPVAPNELCIVEPAEGAALVYRGRARWPKPTEAKGVYNRRDLTASIPARGRQARSRRRDAGAADQPE